MSVTEATAMRRHQALNTKISGWTDLQEYVRTGVMVEESTCHLESEHWQQMSEAGSHAMQARTCCEEHKCRNAEKLCQCSRQQSCHAVASGALISLLD